MIIELVGLPRAGKTSCLNKLMNSYSNLKSIKEDFSNNPYNRYLEIHKSNYWICEKILNDIKKITDSNITIMDRGVIDRIAWTNATFEFKLITNSEKEKELNLLKEDISKINLAILFDISEEVSLNRAKPKSSNYLTRHKDFLKILRKNYLDLKTKYNLKIIDASKDSTKIYLELKKIIELEIKKTQFE